MIPTNEDRLKIGLAVIKEALTLGRVYDIARDEYVFRSAISDATAVALITLCDDLISDTPRKGFDHMVQHRLDQREAAKVPITS